MKNLKSILASTLLITSLLFLQTACRKSASSNPTPSIPITGTWLGTQTEDGSGTSTSISFTLKTDNSLDLSVDGRLVLGSGNWQLTGNAFSATYIYRSDPTASYVYTGTYDSKTGNLSAGIWFIRGTTTRGTFTLSKQ